MTLLSIAVVFLPLVGFILSGALGETLGNRFSQYVTCSLLGVSTCIAIYLFYYVGMTEQAFVIPLFPWIQVEFFVAEWGIQIDSLSIVMLCVVTLVSFFVHIYSIGYMEGDPGIPRFMGYLSLFTFFMLSLVTAPNLLQMFFGWEGVGLCSYLLIGYWYDRDRANTAAIKAFLMNRVGDIGFVLGIITLFVTFGTVEFSSLFELANENNSGVIKFLGLEFHALTLASILLFIGAMGKSAQIGLHTWLPDAMEGPTPVSALIHAATMVTAGVYMVVRVSPLIEYAPFARDFITLIGASTAFMAATIACVQNDIKRIIAYSTCSQLGYMFMAAGLSGYSASMFHLTTHAFFKALLFLGAGSVIHAMSDENNIQKMGGLWKFIPVTYVCMWIGSLALAGIPFFSGYYSKDMIIDITWASPVPVAPVAFTMGIAAALLTAFYAWRLIFLAFHGKPRADEVTMSHLHESPLVMLIPILGLALGAIFSGVGLYTLFVGETTTFWGAAISNVSEKNIIELAHNVSLSIKLIPLFMSLIGIGVAYYFYAYAKSWPEYLVSRYRILYQFLINKWYFDDIYYKYITLPFLKLAKILWVKGDQKMIDGWGPNGFAHLSLIGGRYLCRLQTGYIYHYAFAMIIGLIIMLAWSYWM